MFGMSTEMIIELRQEAMQITTTIETSITLNDSILMIHTYRFGFDFAGQMLRKADMNRLVGWRTIAKWKILLS